MKRHEKYNFIILIGVAVTGICLGLMLRAPVAHAADLTIAPAVIDAHGLPLDMMHYDLTVTNTSGRQINVFASVYELTADGQQVFTDPSTSDQPVLLADWMDVSRGAMMFTPGESKDVPVDITINPYATAGVYHAVIAFVEGGTRSDAEQNLNGAPQALVTMTVASNAKEALQLDDFSAAKNFYSGFPISFNYTVENTGNVPSVPTGVVLLYDRIGHEIGSIDANPSSTVIGIGEKHRFTATWESGPSFGQYKAVLNLSYGASDATLANTVLFWILPWQKILIIFVVLLIAVIVAAVFIHREYERRHYRRQRAIERLLQNRGAGHDRKVVDLRHPHDHD